MSEQRNFTSLPRILHQTIDIPESDRIIIIGDVHGCYDEIHDLLQACNYDKQMDKVIFVGDLVNKGPKSCEAVRYVRTSGAYCVRGNHDDAALNAYYQWKSNSPDYVRESRYAYVEKFMEEDIKFLEELPYTITLPNQNAIVVHAGLVPGIPLTEQTLNNMYKMRFIQENSGINNADCKDAESSWHALETASQDTDNNKPLLPWATQWKGPTHIYFGHDAKAGLQLTPFATGLDTGCCYGKSLTACILPTKEIVAVPAKKVYCQPAGR